MQNVQLESGAQIVAATATVRGETDVTMPMASVPSTTVLKAGFSVTIRLAAKVSNSLLYINY